MLRLLMIFDCCLAKPGHVGQWEGQVDLGLNVLGVTGANDVPFLGPRVCNYKT